MALGDYTPTIGLETHVQFKTRTKLFAGVGNDAREAEPNTLISHICLGMPGALPVLNEGAVALAMRAAFALGTSPQLFSKFDRKHYFYPDLPLGYQITQFDEPVILGGFVDIEVDGQTKRINLTRAHLEADAGKSTHPAGADYSLVDLNRAGTPLLEIVSEPEIKSAAEAKAYAHELYLLMKYAGVSEADLYHGNMRFDVNVSVSKDPAKMGTRSETKNLNSFKAVEKAVEYEIKRQIEVLEKGGEIVQETRGWDDAKQKTFSQRTKEDAHDYRYFPDPDLPPVILDPKAVEEARALMPNMPSTHRRIFRQLGLNDSQIETLLEEPDISRFITGTTAGLDPEISKILANWLTGEVVRWVTDEKIKWNDIIEHQSPVISLAMMVNESKLSSTAGKEVLLEVLKSGANPEEIAATKNLLQESDEGALDAVVAEVLNANAKAAEDVKNGEMKAIGFLVGQVMKSSGGKANPQVVQNLIRKQLGI